MLHRWKIIFTSPSIAFKGCVFLDGKELTGVRAISLEARIDDVVRLTLEVLPGSLEVEGYGKPEFAFARPSLWQKIKHALAI